MNMRTKKAKNTAEVKSMNPKKKNNIKKDELKKIWRPDGKNPTDVLGSYIGTGRKDEQPEQDADDL